MVYQETWRNMERCKSHCTVSLCPENTVDCHVACWTQTRLQLSHPKRLIAAPAERRRCSRSLTATLDTAPRECNRLINKKGVAHTAQRKLMETEQSKASPTELIRTHQNSSELHDLKKSNLLWFKEQSGMGLLSMGLSFHVAENSFNPHAKWAPFSFQSPSASISGDLRSWCTLAFTAYVGEQKPPQITNLLKRHLCASSNSAPSTTPLGTFSVQTHQHSPHLPFAQHASGFFKNTCRRSTGGFWYFKPPDV